MLPIFPLWERDRLVWNLNRKRHSEDNKLAKLEMGEQWLIVDLGLVSLINPVRFSVPDFTEPVVELQASSDERAGQDHYRCPDKTTQLTASDSCLTTPIT